MPQISTHFNFALELLDFLVQDHKNIPTSLLVCCTREEFFHQVLEQIQHHSPPEAPTSSELAEPGLQQPLLRPTLDLLAASSSVKLVYCPSLPVLRAQLSSYAGQQPDLPPGRRLVILDLIALHHGTSEFTLQGLSRTLSAAVSVAFQTESELKLVECKDISDPTNPNRGPSLWAANVPLLSGAIKIGQDGSRWIGREIPIRKISARWFEFESEPSSHLRAGPENEDEGDEDMLI